MTNDRMTDRHTGASNNQLTDDQLEHVAGGQKAVAPRDSVSGNATGRRVYKAVDFA